ncbi:MAG: FeoB-associated Cys-rich membrane protein [Oscillibacter sp.]|nr:FeoB-associated Cys-rich membrane protein [Oscillibacter sp.]
MSPILGNAIALLAVALLVTVCARYLWKDAKRGGCAGCAGCGNGHCARCPGHVRKEARP